ncbi:MAG: Ig-like domain-containing protein [Candidatus Moraniibacteriota bacterium]
MKNIKKHRFLELAFLCLAVAVLTIVLNVSAILAEQGNSMQLSSERTVGSNVTRDTVSVPEASSDSSASSSTNNNLSEAVSAVRESTSSESKSDSDSKSKTSSKSKSDANSSDDGAAELTPAFSFSSPKKEETVKGKISIEGVVASAKGVEFYSVPSGSNTKKYIGTAHAQSKNVWKLDFYSKDFPNGTFYLMAKIDNKYGTYESGKIKIYISNPAVIDAEKPNPDVSDQKIKTQAAVDQAVGSQIVNAPDENNLAGKNNEQISQEEIKNQNISQWQLKYFKDEKCQDANYCGGNGDPDKDGLNNEEEFRYNTDPLNPDSDGDGFLEGDEVQNGFNPLKYSPGDKSDKIVFESPKEKGEIKKELYEIKTVELVENQADGKKRLKLSGKGLPNSFVNIYIYSSLPIILTVKTDSEGNWSYELDKQLEDGEHEVFVAVTDNTGKITAKSEPLPFVKTAEAVNMIEKNTSSGSMKLASPPTQIRKNSDLIMILVIILLSLGLALSILGTIAARRANKETM